MEDTLVGKKVKILGCPVSDVLSIKGKIGIIEKVDIKQEPKLFKVTIDNQVYWLERNEFRLYGNKFEKWLSEAG